MSYAEWLATSYRPMAGGDDEPDEAEVESPSEEETSDEDWKSQYEERDRSYKELQSKFNQRDEL